LEKGFYGIPVVPIVEREDRMSQTQDTIVAALINLAMRLERERFLGAGLYERWHRAD
jgi:hypothetical protein